MKLYAFPPSPNSAKVLALIGELGLPIEVAVLDITKGQSRTPAMLAINPSGRTPVLVDGAMQLWESNAILQYLASRTASPMWPVGDAARADIMRWQSWSLAHWTPPLQTLTFERTVKRLVGAGDPDEARCAEAEARFHPEDRILDQHLTGRNWISGYGLTIADFEVGSNLMYAAAARHPIEAYPNIRAWYARLCARPAWRNALEPILADA